MRVGIAQPRDKVVLNGDEHPSTGCTNDSAVDLDPREPKLEGLGRVDRMRDDDLNRSDGQVRGSKQRNIDHVTAFERPFLGGSQNLSWNELMGFGFAALFVAASHKGEGLASMLPVVDDLHEESFGGEVNDALRAARRRPMMKVAAFDLACMKIDRGAARRAGVAVPASRMFRRDKPPRRIVCKRNTEAVTRRHGAST